MAKRFDICTPRPKQDGGTFWLRVGTAFQNDTGLITCFLDAVPTPVTDQNGNPRIQFSLFEPRDNYNPPKRPDNKKGGKPDFQKELDDEIPF